MGCDIHAIAERQVNPYGDVHYWVNSGTPGISRNYVLFSLLANVRNDWEPGFPYIDEPRGVPGYEIKTGNYGRFEILGESTDWGESASNEYTLLCESYGADGHSHSWVTLRELKDAESDIIMYPWEGDVPDYIIDEYNKLLEYMERQKYDGQTDDQIRLVFFFDN